MQRYSIVTSKNKREVVLLKASPCIWGKCSFCDYILDNSPNQQENIILNKKVLKKVSGIFKSLEVINSGSVFELPYETLVDIKNKVHEKNINKLFFESHWYYKERLKEIEDFFGIPIIFKFGVETFDDYFRNKVLNKGAYFNHHKEVSKYFKSICLLVGIKGQTKDMIDRDIDCLLRYFDYGCINIFTPNTTKIEQDKELIEWFKNKYSFLESYANIEILWNNIDWGIGG
ncbi:radical SAM protein [Caldicellulosiruptoraceae bacterium PP1]